MTRTNQDPKPYSCRRKWHGRITRLANAERVLRIKPSMSKTPNSLETIQLVSWPTPKKKFAFYSTINLISHQLNPSTTCEPVPCPETPAPNSLGTIQLVSWPTPKKKFAFDLTINRLSNMMLPPTI